MFDWQTDMIVRYAQQMEIQFEDGEMSCDAKRGDWVQVRQVVLEPGQRAPQVPRDTSHVPLIRLVKGFLAQDANLGDTVAITTVIGRTIGGELVAVNPQYEHSFGAPPAGFMRIGSKLRRILGDAK